MELGRASPASVYDRWEEFYVSSDKGKREVHYYLKRKDGTGSDLAVIGKEKTLRHMSYHFAFKGSSLLFNFANSSSFLAKLRSRREVVDWLNSIIDSDLQPQQSTRSAGVYVERKDDNPSDVTIVQDMQTQKLGQGAKVFKWLGSPWTCRKRRRHYQSFSRNGVQISVHDFVYVLAEEGERLVAHLDDMYEDSKGNKMVVVRWFHKLEEVGTVLPRNYNDREIFFSLCLQDLSIECIDGLATVLSPEHYEKFLNEAKYTQLEPFICHRQFDNDEVKPLDITQVKGYWKQDALQYMLLSSPVESQLPFDIMKMEENPSDSTAGRPKKRLRRSQECDRHLQTASGKVNIDASLEDCIRRANCKGFMGSLKEGFPSASIGKNTVGNTHMQCLSIGSQVEVLSQDSGMRGCWFRALIVKKHKDKVKVQYQDIKDVTDEAKNLEEWVLASRLAAPDALSIRISGRTIVRPAPGSNKGKVSWVFNVGTLVDVWWNDGWWEGIVVKKESKDQLHVYFPGEKQELIFGCGDLRHSQEWLGNGWKELRERPDIVSALSGVEIRQQDTVTNTRVKPEKAAYSRQKDLCKNHLAEPGGRKFEELKVVRDLAKDDFLSKLRWKSSRRRHGRSPVHKVHCAVNEGGENRVEHRQNYQRFFMPSTWRIDPDNCKYISDTLFSSSVVSPFSNLVMSR